VGERVADKCSATSKSAVSRRFVAMTETALAELLAADLSGLDLVALMIDGVHFAESCCIVALCIDIEGNKHPLALVEGSTENATLVCGLLVDLRGRGLDVTRPMLVGIDGSKALRKAVLDVLDRPVIQRCQLHKIITSKIIYRNDFVAAWPQDDRCLPCRFGAGGRGSTAGPGDRTRSHPPRGGGQPARGPRRDAHGAAPRRATHPRPHPALDERHRVDDLGVPRTCRQRQTLARRADGAALVCGRDDRGRQAIRRVNGHLHLPTLRAALERQSAESVGPVVHDDQVNAA